MESEDDFCFGKGGEDTFKHRSSPQNNPEIKEIKKIAREYYRKEGLKVQKDLDNEVKNLKIEIDTLIEIWGYTRSYIESHPQDFSLQMPFGYFLDCIEREKSFDNQTMSRIHYYMDQNEGKVNLEKPVEDFLELLEKILWDKQFLLNPGPEEPGEEGSVEDSN